MASFRVSRQNRANPIVRATPGPKLTSDVAWLPYFTLRRHGTPARETILLAGMNSKAEL